MSLPISFLIINEHNLTQEDLFQNTETFNDVLVQTPSVLFVRWGYNEFRAQPYAQEVKNILSSVCDLAVGYMELSAILLPI